MDFTTLTIELLKTLSNIVGSYGWGIILLTVVIRLAMWPLGVSQQRSMKMMQTLQPKLKAIQDRYKSDPQVMQRKMMEFYKEHKFNPMSGCFPLLIQMPIFILLYTALMSPQFIQIAGDTQFLFINRLDATLKTTAGISYDGEMGVSKYDNFFLGKSATVYLPKETLENVKVEKPTKALEIQGDVVPGEPIDFKISLDSLDLKFSQLDQIQKAEFTISNAQNKESEKVNFMRKGGILAASMPTKAVKSSFHYDVLILIILFGLTMVATQKIMMSTTTPQQQDPTQQALQKSMGTFMPIMIMATFVFIPIPAGVLLYLIASNVIQVVQTVVINKQLEAEDAKKKQKIDDDAVNTAKKIEIKKEEV
ncbi:MAG: YidC/Oxa1 family membrane protein insertase [Candidatus Gastranaerophilaceae bacterium]